MEIDFKKNSDTTSLDTACYYFRQICQQIGMLIGNLQFKGSFAQITEFYAHESYQTKKGMHLAVALTGCKKLCSYQAKKLGIINWFDICWKIVNSSSSSQSSQSSQSSRGQRVSVSWLQKNWSEIPGFIYKGNNGIQYFYGKTYIYGTIDTYVDPGEIIDTLYINGVKIQGEPEQASDYIAKFLKDRDPYIADWWFEQVYAGGWKYGGLIFYQAKDGGMSDDGTMQTRTYLIGAADCELYSNSSSIDGIYRHSCVEGGTQVTVTIQRTQEQPMCFYNLNHKLADFDNDATETIGFSKIVNSKKEYERLWQQYYVNHSAVMETLSHTFDSTISAKPNTEEHEHIITSCYGLYEVDGEWTLFLPDSSHPLEVTGGTEYSDDGVKKTSSNPLSAIYGEFKSSVYEKSGKYYLYLD